MHPHAKHLSTFASISTSKSLTLRRVLSNANDPLLNCFWIAPIASSRKFRRMLKTAYVWQLCVVRVRKCHLEFPILFWSQKFRGCSVFWESELPPICWSAYSIITCTSLGARIKSTCGQTSIATTVRPLITHTPRWTAQAMGLQGLWVYGGGKKISAHESHKNFEKILFSLLQ